MEKYERGKGKQKHNLNEKQPMVSLKQHSLQSSSVCG